MNCKQQQLETQHMEHILSLAQQQDIGMVVGQIFLGTQSIPNPNKVRLTYPNRVWYRFGI